LARSIAATRILPGGHNQPVGLYSAIARPLLFRSDPERAHRLALRWLAVPGFARLLCGPPHRDPRLAQELAGITFPNPIGLAAGFDKDGEAVEAWATMGFGFAELGTVTPRPQSGNPQPRLFRLPADCALINRMGFNNAGAAALGDRLRSRSLQIPVGVNLGKNRDTPLERAAEDYASAVLSLGWSPAYFAVNVSSPNTPGLRELQDPLALSDIVDAVRQADGRLAPHNRITPLFVKVSPDLSTEDLEAVVDVALRKRIAGIIATNTTLSREGLRTETQEEGGLSGAPLHSRSTEMVRAIRRLAGERILVIGTGGVSSVEDVLQMLRAGANLVQVYTALVYEGPTVVRRLCRGLSHEMDRLRAASLQEIAAPEREYGTASEGAG